MKSEARNPQSRLEAPVAAPRQSAAIVEFRQGECGALPRLRYGRKDVLRNLPAPFPK